MTSIIKAIQVPALLAALLTVGCSVESEQAPLDSISEDYVQLVLAMGAHDPNYVDAYFGPEAWRETAPARFPTLDAIADEAARLRARIAALAAPHADLVRRRIEGLEKRLVALEARIAIVSGETMTFDQETRLVYDAAAPDHDWSHFEGILGKLDDLLPGDGELYERALAFRDEFIIPPERLDAVFSAAIQECRRRTAANLELPPNEDFTLEYVKDKPWSGYNWFKGDAFSLIQINTDLPRHIDRAVDLGCHEGYPGHHTYGALLERELFKGRGWLEFSVYPLFSPQSLLSEGSANFGIELAFPGDERISYERSVLFPLAGLSADRADTYYRFLELRRQLNYARNEVARDYLDGKISRERGAEYLQRYQLQSAEEADQSMAFIETYRAYVINYNLGLDLVRSYIERKAGDDQTLRWRVFEALLSEPVSVSDLSD